MTSDSLDIAVLGSGNIGRNAAIHFLKAGHRVFLANSRGPESLRETIDKLGDQASATTVAEAVKKAEIVLLAVPWPAKEAMIEAAGGAQAFAGKIVIDALNPYTEYPAVEDLAGQTSSEFVAHLLGRAARVVKAFNTIYYETLAAGARTDVPPAQRIAIPICGDDVAAKQRVFALIDAIGFAPVDIGHLALSHLQEPGQPLYDKNFTPVELRAELARLGHAAT